MPDAALAPLAAARPAEWWRLGLASLAGSLAGGLASYALGRVRPAEAIMARLPLVRPAMVEAARAWLAAEGARGLRHQPLSGLPYKVFALLAGSARLPLGPFLLWSAAARGARFMAVARAAAWLGRRYPVTVRRHSRPLLTLWSIAVATGLRRTLLAWERRGADRGS